MSGRLQRVGLAATMCFAYTASADRIHVDHESTATTPDGSSWALAFPNLQGALDWASIPANNVTETWIADGTYYPSAETIPNTPSSVTFLMQPGVIWYGGFQGISRPGGGETQLSQRNVDLYETILSGNIGNPSSSTDNALRVVTAVGSGITQSARLNGVTIRDALLFGLWIREGATPLVIRCTFTENDNPGSTGSAVRFDDNGWPSTSPGTAQFLACTFSNNHGSHGVVYSVVPVEILLINCIAFNNEGADSGFITADADTDLTMINCTITENHTGAATQSAVKFVGTNCLISNCILWGNSQGETHVQDEDAQLFIDASGSALVKNCDIQGLNYFAGSGNFSALPQFYSASGHDFRIGYFSPALNNGDAGDMPADSFDIDDDSNTTEAMPDRGMQNRQVNPSACVDVGVFEEQTQPCSGDITGGTDGSPDTNIDINDLLAVILAWGSSGGFADFETDCGDVNINELLAVISNWGTCQSGGGSIPEHISDCFEYCDGLTGTDYQLCMQRCIEAVCQNNPSECE